MPPPPFVPPAWSDSGFPLLLISDCFTGSRLAPQLLHLVHNHLHVLMSLCSNICIFVRPSQVEQLQPTMPKQKSGLHVVPIRQKPKTKNVMAVFRFFKHCVCQWSSYFRIDRSHRRDRGGVLTRSVNRPLLSTYGVQVLCDELGTKR